MTRDQTHRPARMAPPRSMLGEEVVSALASVLRYSSAYVLGIGKAVVTAANPVRSIKRVASFMMEAGFAAD